MPLPPPTPSTEGRRDRHVPREIGQIVRALEDQGPAGREELAVLVGGKYWETERFDRALRLAISDGVVTRLSDGRYTVGGRR